MSFRKELKYIVDTNEQKIFKSYFLQKKMRTIFPKRTINSFYFDTKNLDLFRLGQEGVLPRKKIRLRWYNNNTKFCLKEQKFTTIEGRFKLTNKFKEFEIGNIKNYQFLDSIYGKLKPVILIIYNREYFLYNGMRLTFDSDINYCDIMSLSQTKRKDCKNVIEVKTNIETSNDFINYNIGTLDSSFSKYNRGLEILNKIQS